MKLGYLMPLTVDNIVTARKLNYDALEANVGWMTGSDGCLAEGPARDKEALARRGSRSPRSRSTVTLLRSLLKKPSPSMDGRWTSRESWLQRRRRYDRRDNSLAVEDNLVLFEERLGRSPRWQPTGNACGIRALAGQVTGYGPYNWANMAVSPGSMTASLRLSRHPLGIEYDASHFVWQGIDHLQVFRDYAVASIICTPKTS